MPRAAIAELKARLSEYLLKVKAGEELIVTDRGKPVAKIVPFKGGKRELPPHLLAMEKAGLIRIGTGAIPDRLRDMPRIRDPKGLALKALLKEREESR